MFRKLSLLLMAVVLWYLPSDSVRAQGNRFKSKPANYGQARSGLARHQNAERHALQQHQKAERKWAKSTVTNRAALADHQRAEREELRRHQRVERRRLRP